MSPHCLGRRAEVDNRPSIVIFRYIQREQARSLRRDFMSRNTQFYIDGQWVDPVSPNLFDVVNPATEEVAGQISLGSNADVDLAVAAARRAFPRYSRTTRKERVALVFRRAS
jgi:delta 1-pyrroline-5-carboxylate dehydrogenase